MSTDASHTNVDAALSAPANGRPMPKKITNAQTVCNEKNEKGKLCNGHLKQLRTGDEEAEVHLRGDDVLFKCQTCGTLYMGPPLGHVRDPRKQQRFVQKELTMLLQAAGGTLPAFRKSETGAWIPADHTPAPAKTASPPPPPSSPASAAKPIPAQAAAPAAPRATNAVPSNETFEEKRVRLARVVAGAKARDGKISPNEIEATVAALLSKGAGQTRPAAAVTSGINSSAAADVYRPAAEAQAATGQASAAPLSPAAATASPAAPPPTGDDEEVQSVVAPAPAASTAAPAVADATPSVDAAPARKSIPPPPPHLAPPPGETFEQKKARLAQVVADAKARAGKS